MRYVFHAALLVISQVAWAGPVELQIVGVDGRAMAGTVVTLRSTDIARPVARAAAARIDQVNLQFVPHVLVVPTGSPITFPNSDSVSHQVYSFSPAKRFQLPLYQGKAYAPEVFGREGIVTLGCNIHDQMRAYVYVVEAQYYGRADHHGHWSVPNVEPGEYTLTIWHPLSRGQDPVLEQKVTIRADGAPLKLQAAMPLKLRSESKVPANWDVY